MPTPDPSWPAQAVAAFVQREQGLDLVRLAIYAGVVGLALVLFLLAISSVGVLRR